MTGDTQREETSGELNRNEKGEGERVQVDAKQHPS
jgi:hypothetical protein